VDFITAFKSNNDFGALLGHMLCTAGQYYELVGFGCASIIKGQHLESFVLDFHESIYLLHILYISYILA
jgi:hypothetical protein